MVNILSAPDKDSGMRSRAHGLSYTGVFFFYVFGANSVEIRKNARSHIFESLHKQNL